MAIPKHDAFYLRDYWLPYANGSQSHISNGSLWSQLDAPFVLPQAKSDPGINLALSPDLTNINIGLKDPGGYAFLALSTLTTFASSNVTRGTVTCAYPLSGQYGRLGRFLFYLAMIFGVLFRHRAWAAEAAMGLIILYSSATTVHLFVMLIAFGWSIPSPPDTELTFAETVQRTLDDATMYGDIDFFGIVPVIALSVVMLIPTLSWSKTFRHHKQRILVQCWAILMFVSFVPVLYYFWKYNETWQIPATVSVAFCNTGADCVPKVRPGDYAPFYQNRDQYEACKCFDLCGTIAPEAYLRAGTAMAPFVLNGWALKLYEQVSEDVLATIEPILFGLWIAGLALGVTALLGSGSSPDRVRDAIFWMVNADYHDLVEVCFKGKRREQLSRLFGQHHERGRVYSCIRELIAKLFAVSYYGLSILGLVLCPVIAILTIILLEFFLIALPSSERSSAVGAWTPWVGVGCAVVSAMILWAFEYCQNHHIGSQVRNWIQYGPEDRPVYERHRVRFQWTRKSGANSQGDKTLGPLREFGKWVSEHIEKTRAWWANPAEAAHQKLAPVNAAAQEEMISSDVELLRRNSSYHAAYLPAISTSTIGETSTQLGTAD